MTEQITSFVDIIRQMALLHPRLAFETSSNVYNLRPSRASLEPRMLDEDGDLVEAHRAENAVMDGGYITVTEYPREMTTVAIGSEHMTLVRREWRGDEKLTQHYVFCEDLERFRATGVFGEIEDHDPDSFFALLQEHGVISERGLTCTDAEDSVYVEFLREHGASANVIED